MLPTGHPLTERLANFGSSEDALELKTFPLLDKESVFAICWQIGAGKKIRATMLPSPRSFSCEISYADYDHTVLHTHDYIELAYVVSGRFTQEILGHDISFRAGDLCLVDRNCIHRDCLDTDSPCDNAATVLFLGISDDMFYEVMDAGVSSGRIISFLQTALKTQKTTKQFLHFHPKEGFSSDGRAFARSAPCSELEECLIALINELLFQQAGSIYIRRGLLIRIFRILSTGYDFTLSKEQREEVQNIYFEEITDYISQNIATVSIKELASRFHFQEDYFNRLIKKNTGMTYVSYLQSMRIKRAEGLLLNSKRSIEDIASSVGYMNRSFFYDLFERTYGMTPSVYRKRFSGRTVGSPDI